MEKNLEQTALEIGTAMLESGAEINRIENTVERILLSGGRKHVNVFCINSIIIISTEEKTTLKRVKKIDIDLFEIDRLNSLSRLICNGEKPKSVNQSYSVTEKYIATFLGTFSFCLFFGGNIFDAVIAGIAGIIISLKKPFYISDFGETMLNSFIAGIISIIPALFFPFFHSDKIMIGAIMLLVPGLTITNSIRDIMNSDIVSGLIELTQAIFTALAISLGYAGAAVIFKWQE